MGHKPVPRGRPDGAALGGAEEVTGPSIPGWRSVMLGIRRRALGHYARGRGSSDHFTRSKIFTIYIEPSGLGKSYRTLGPQRRALLFWRPAVIVCGFISRYNIKQSSL
jgi:hypothetical protein